MVYAEIFESKQPDVKLVGTIQSPYDLSVATARTCYSSKGIISPEEVSKDETARVLRDRIAASTREAGHLTTRQHAHFVFAIDHISRSLLWEFFHAHPFYNSEQVSQRYVKVKGGDFTIPKLTPKQRTAYEAVLNRQMGAYESLIKILLPAVREEYYRIFPSRLKFHEDKVKGKKWRLVIQKKTYEIARYVLPVATQAYLYHTVSALTLMRYHRMSQSPNASAEQKFVVRRMVEEVLKSDPDFEKDLPGGFSYSEGPGGPGANARRIHPDRFHSQKAFVTSFDKKLKGKSSLLIDSNQHAQETLAQAVRLMLAKTEKDLSTSAAIDLVLNPAKNRDLGDTVNITTLSPLSRSLFSVHYTFLKKLSHTGDSQNQRHRMTPAARPFLGDHYFGEPDVIYPKIMLRVPEAKSLYDDVIAQSVETINRLLKEGVPFESAQYLLPNGWAVRFEESGDLLNWHHKWKLRTCYNAQEEIFYASVDELTQVAKVTPEIAKHILAPCYLRKEASMKPYCPEGDRYCGVPVWKYDISQYQRLI